MGKNKKTKSQRAIIRRDLESSKSKARRNRMMISSLIIAIVAVSIYFGFFSSGNENDNVQNIADTRPVPPQAPTPKLAVEPATNPKPETSGPIKAKWIDPQIDADIASIPVNEVENNVNVHFGLDTGTGKMNFMAYMLGDEIHVRANVCPPCRSVGFSLQEDILVCDRCATTFEAKTGNGIQGPCVDYPKATVLYSITDGNIVMHIADLKASTQDTIIPG